jgi:hypothetical protein
MFQGRAVMIILGPPRQANQETIMDPNYPTLPVDVPAAHPKRGLRSLFAALLLAGVLGVVGVGAALAQDASAEPSATPSATDGTTDSESDGRLCPDKADEAEADGAST